MKKIMMVVSAVFIAATFMTVVFAQDRPAASSENPEAPITERVPAIEKQGKIRARPFAGEVLSIDRASKILVVKGKKCEATFDVTDAKFAKAYTLQDVKPGDRVLVRLEEKDGKTIAKYVVKAVGKPRKIENRGVKSEEKLVAIPQKPVADTAHTPLRSPIQNR